MRLTLLAAALLPACAAPRGGYTAPPPVPAGVTARPVERYYPVSGTTALEMLRSLRENGPSSDGRRAWGLHEWNVRWTYRYAPVAGACRMQRVQVVLSSVTTMPRWLDREHADSALIRDWDRLVTALRTHENGHRDIAYAAAREVQRALRRMSAPSCGLMSARANARAQEILRKHRERNRAYDEDTRGGRTQGVAWPPRPASGLP